MKRILFLKVTVLQIQLLSALRQVTFILKWNMVEMRLYIQVSTFSDDSKITLNTIYVGQNMPKVKAVSIMLTNV